MTRPGACAMSMPAVLKTVLAAVAGLGCLALIGCSKSELPAPSADKPPQDSSGLVHSLADELWQYYQQQDYDYLQKQGIPITKVTDATFEQAQREADYAQSMLDKLAAVDMSRLDHQDWLTARVMKQRLSQQVEGLQYYWLQFDVVPYSTYSWSSKMADIAATYKLDQPADLENYLTFLGEYAGLIEQLGDKLKIQQEKGILLPQPAIDNVINLFKHFEAVAAKSFTVAGARLSAFNAQDIAAFTGKVNDLVEKRLKPAYVRIYTYFNDDYRKRAPAGVGLRQFPGGKEYYRFLIRQYLGPDETPERVRDIGLKEVAAAQEKMASIRKQLKFNGTQLQFAQMLRSDPRFNAGSVEKLQAHYVSYIHRLEPLIPTYFNKVPKAPYAVERLDPALEASITAGYYQEPTASTPEGIYWFNGANLKEQSVIRTAPLLYHELIPGHHFQICLMNENEGLPRIRKMGTADISAYTEGWAEYAANYVAVEAGMYKDIWDQYGLGLDESFVGVRLVVDTGMNYFDTDLKTAREYFYERSIHTRAQVNSDTLRYAVDMPAQALGYRMGYLKHVELRQRAERELGKDFDVRRYHDAVLGYGPLPLNILAEHIDWFIAEEKKRLGAH